MAERAYAGVRQVCLIGSGDLLVDTAQALKRERFTVSAILAPRHVDEALPLLGGIVGKRLEEAKVQSVSAAGRRLPSASGRRGFFRTRLWRHSDSA